MEDTGIVRDETYKGRRITVKRLKTEDCKLVPSSFKYTFEAYIDRKPITTASMIEERGYEKPWIPALTRYMKAYIDGMHDSAHRETPH